MAHYAFLDENNIVTEVITGRNEDELHIDWEDYYSKVRKQPCKRTSYNSRGGVHSDGKTAFRKNYAGKGYMYDPNRDAFIPPKPYTSWILDEETCLWKAPVDQPNDGVLHKWNESTLSWE